MIHRVRSRLNQLRRDTAAALGMPPSFMGASGSRILVYHGVCKGDPLRFNTLFLRLDQFESQLKLYKQHCNIVSLDDYYAGRFEPDRFTLCLSFDDGFANNYEYVLPLLERYQVPATFFVTGIRNEGMDILWNDFLAIARHRGPGSFLFRKERFFRNKHRQYVSAVDQRRLADKLRVGGFEHKLALMRQLEPMMPFRESIPEEYWLQMSITQLKALSKSPWATIACHGYYHNDLAKISAEELRDELIQVRKFIQSIPGSEPDALAFPYGSYNREVVSVAKEIGFTKLLTTEYLFPEDESDGAMRARLTINPYISNLNQMHANVNGNYHR